MATVCIKNMDEKAYEVARMFAVKEGKNVGEVISEALMLLTRVKRKKGFAALKPLNFGKGTEKLSLGIDEILYGG